MKYVENLFKSLFKKYIKQSISVIGGTFTVTTFLFFVIQNAVKDMPNITALSWIIPIIICLLLFAFFLLFYAFVIRHKNTVFAHDTEKNFVIAFIEYINIFKGTGER